jgi:hypothetical protein
LLEVGETFCGGLFGHCGEQAASGLRVEQEFEPRVLVEGFLVVDPGCDAAVAAV